MGKTEKPSRASSARAASHPTSVSKAASSKKKKKTSSSNPAHSASLGDELTRMQDPGKLKPIKPQPAKAKAPKTKSATAEEQKLENQLLVASALRKSKKGAAADEDDMMDDDAESDFDQNEADEEEQMAKDEASQISARLSKKILSAVHEQQREELEGEGVEEERQGANNSARRMKQISLQATVDGEEDMSDAGEDEDDEEEDDGGMEEIELSAEDQASLEMFMPKSAMKSKSLADVIFEKMREKEAAGAPSHGSNVHFGPGFGVASSKPQGEQDAAEIVRAKLDPKIVEVYTKSESRIMVGKFLSHYSSGKIPKAFKLIPNLKSWEEILFLTNPEGWSCQAYFVATRIFSSNFNPKMAQRFYSVILLPKIRNDIESNKHLNFHLYQAIKKSLYKPAAFFKGLLLPLAEEGASAREAVIMSSILAKCTIPVLHSSVALLKLAQMDYSGTTALFMRTLLNKKYSLPRKVLSALVQYFCAFLHKSAAGAALGGMPLIWHQTLLAFVQRYKLELTSNQLTALKNLIKVQTHHGVSTEIRRELAAVSQQQQVAAGGVSAGAGFQFGAKTSSANSGPATFSFGLTPGFTSLAASIKNPTQFNIPTADAAQMEQ